jgi:hypothetical protein
MHKLTAEETRSIIGDASSGDVLKAKLVTAGADPEWFVVRRTPPQADRMRDAAGGARIRGQLAG